MPSLDVSNIEFVYDLLVFANQAKSKGEAKRLIEGGAVTLDDIKICDVFAKIPQEMIAKGNFILHKGKKVHIKINVK